MAEAEAQYVTPDQLCVGLYIHLDLAWMDHPFTFSSFKIKNDEQIETLRGLGLERIRYDPERSDVLPRRVFDEPEAQPEQPAAPRISDAAAAALAEKKARMAQLARLREEIEEVERRFTRAAESLKHIARNVFGQPEQAFAEADGLVSDLVDTALSKGDVKIHAMSQQLGEDVYFHSLNVSVLALILGRTIHLRPDEMHQLGLGALFHDIGQNELPGSITAKKEPLTRAEQAVYEQHCKLGLKVAKRLGLSERATLVLLQHHEMADGSGYPERLQGNQISLFARIVAICNTYDNLCNPPQITNALTPAEALAQMFALQRAKFDDGLLRSFIKCLGVYPPGSLVQLSNGQFGLVLSVNPNHPTKPSVMLYDPHVPKEAALIVDLEREDQLKITKSLRAALLSREALAYLSPRQRVTYYFDQQQNKRPG